MTKKEALRRFKQDYLPHYIDLYGKNDKIAAREGWSDFTDFLCKDGEITLRQYETWDNPF